MKRPNLFKIFNFVALLLQGLLSTTVTASTVEEPQVVLDGVEIHGGDGMSREMLEAAIGITVEVPMPRSVLDEQVLAARQRLEALALYESVDAQLVKGRVRDHYRLVVALGPAHPWYAGVNAVANKDNSDRGYLGQHRMQTNQHQEEFYAGSRALFGSGFRGEMEWRMPSLVREVTSVLRRVRSQWRAQRFSIRQLDRHPGSRGSILAILTLQVKVSTRGAPLRR